MQDGRSYQKTYQSTMPMKTKDVKVVIVCTLPEYGVPPADECGRHANHGLGSIAREYNRTSGRVPYLFHDYRAWKRQGVLMLDLSTRNHRNAIHYLRMISLHNTNVVFNFVGQELDIPYLSTLLSEGSHESNFFFNYNRWDGSNLFKNVNITRKYLKLPPIDWNPI